MIGKNSRLLKIQFGKTSNGYLNPKMTLPKVFVDALGLAPDDRNILMILDETEGCIKLYKSDDDKNDDRINKALYNKPPRRKRGLK